jgi:hypothetical protein
MNLYSYPCSDFECEEDKRCSCTCRANWAPDCTPQEKFRLYQRRNRTASQMPRSAAIIMTR